MIIHIKDDFDAEKIANCGQTFRAIKMEDGAYRFVTRDHVLYLSEMGDDAEGHKLEVSCSEEEWNAVWVPYFDLNTDYAELRASIQRTNAYTDKVCEAGAGIRIIRQDLWEMLVTFIISQRRSIPAIRTCVEKICAAMGEKVDTGRETLYLFPDAETLLNAGPDVLAECGVGYRLPYIRDAAERVVSGALDLNALQEADDETLLAALLEVKGVGVKVGNCIALFAYGRMGCAPVDVWIRRAIDEFFGGQDPFESQGELAGLLQQYMFYYAQVTK